MELEKNLNTKRGIIGYNPMEVSERYQSIQDWHQREQEWLQKELNVEKERNKQLKEMMEEITEPSIQNTLVADLTEFLESYFLNIHDSILQLKGEFEEKESLLQEKLIEKNKEKEMTLKRIQKALDLFIYS
ncbi:hypothetical protein HPT25_11360 [Bacillus sp. BRMEA1]|uniref:hypothetical protein n=1 Tax=Neobacillus endophyticus TaxID=2738405 RepID=UPI001566C9BF|nr:hypothetical protein [Neobacillus endophyticus]NRD77982.1 hypothetical protein [Neobacillus endophyticus]